MTLGVRALVERSDGKVLLVRHTYTKGLYLPGGGVEKGEIASVSLLRELKEEGGVELAAEVEAASGVPAEGGVVAPITPQVF